MSNRTWALKDLSSGLFRIKEEHGLTPTTVLQSASGVGFVRPVDSRRFRCFRYFRYSCGIMAGRGKSFRLPAAEIVGDHGGQGWNPEGTRRRSALDAGASVLPSERAAGPEGNT